MPYEHIIGKGNKKKQEEKSKNKDRDTKPIRIRKKDKKLIESLKDTYELKSNADAFTEILNDDEINKKIREKIESGEDVFCGEVQDLSTKYLDKKKRLIVAKFVRIIRNCDGEVSFVNEMLDEVLEEVENEQGESNGK